MKFFGDQVSGISHEQWAEGYQQSGFSYQPDS